MTFWLFHDFTVISCVLKISHLPTINHRPTKESCGDAASWDGVPWLQVWVILATWADSTWSSPGYLLSLSLSATGTLSLPLFSICPNCADASPSANPGAASLSPADCHPRSVPSLLALLTSSPYGTKIKQRCLLSLTIWGSLFLLSPTASSTFKQID